jgi:hypothetical protein
MHAGDAVISRLSGIRCKECKDLLDDRPTPIIGVLGRPLALCVAEKGRFGFSSCAFRQSTRLQFYRVGIWTSPFTVGIFHAVITEGGCVQIAECRVATCKISILHGKWDNSRLVPTAAGVVMQLINHGGCHYFGEAPTVDATTVAAGLV